MEAGTTKDANASFSSTADIEMEILRIEEEEHPEEEVIAPVAAIALNSENELIHHQMDESGIELADEESLSTKTRNHEKCQRMFFRLGLIVAFILISIAIFYQVEWRQQQIISQIPKGNSRFSEDEAEAPVEARLTATTTTTTTTSTTTSTPKTTTEYMPSIDYDYYTYADENSPKSEEYHDNDYPDDAPYPRQSNEVVTTAITTIETTTTVVDYDEYSTFDVDTDISEIHAKLQKWSDCAMERNFTLWPKNNEPNADNVSRYNFLNAHCLQCICETASQCSMSARNGLFTISRLYWIDGGSPRLEAKEYGDGVVHDANFYNCIEDQCCAAQTVANFIKKYAKDCNHDGKIDCIDHAMLHVLGPTRCMKEEMSTVHSFRYDMCMGAHSLGL